MTTKVNVSHILVQHKFEAEDLHRRLERGEAFAELAKKYSTCPSAKTGGQLGEVPLAKLDQDFADACLQVKPDQYTAPVRTRFGYHLILRHS